MKTSIVNIHSENPADLAEAASVVKKQCKLVWESCYCMDEEISDLN